MKPEPFMYRASCELLGADTSEYFSNNQVMIGGDGFKNLTDLADHVLAKNSGLPSSAICDPE